MYIHVYIEVPRDTYILHLTPLSNLWWINNIEFGEKKTMLSSSMCLGKQICKLELRWYIPNRNHLILHCRSNVEAVNANVFGELMLHRILSNTNSIGTVRVHRRRGGRG